METIRIQKYVSDCGLMSRRKAEEAIRAGEITVNGAPALIGQKIDPEGDIVLYRGKEVLPETDRKITIKLNKPRGYVATMSDERGRKCVADLVKDVPARVYPIGRLDLDSEGLLLMTNDGELANAVMHPKNEIEKVYLVKVRTHPTDEQMQALNRAMTLDGYTIRPCRVSFADADEDKKLRFVLKEGRNRQIRKMCEKVGLEVARLQRVQEGKIRLDSLRSGTWAELNKQELDYLKSIGV